MKKLLILLFVPMVAFAVTRTQKQVVVSGDMSASITSSAFDAQAYLTVSCQANWTGSSPTGTFKFQISNDSSTTPGNWTDYTGTSYSITTSGDYNWNFMNAGFRWFRLIYTRSSGTGTLNTNCTLKGT